MGTFSRESLELLRSRIDLVEVLGPYLKLQRAGAAYKALCPFHDEKSPSFVIQKGDSHYHCFGCGAHGDAIQFLMTHLRMSFVEAVESLADRFNVPLEEVEKDDRPKGPPKSALKEALSLASQTYQFCLLHTLEGRSALDYLYSRGIDLEFIKAFGIGYAPRAGQVIQKMLQAQKISPKVLEDTGLVVRGREFFSDRITIPIRDSIGAVIGFSARKFKPDTFGGKYVNTPETVLFKKSKMLFGLSYCRKNIAKEKRALIVEGQIDALRLIHLGFSWAVAGQGTAFGEDQAKELIHLGVRKVYLALDGDPAGREAAIKIGHFFQKDGIEVLVVQLPEKCDPDLILQEKGPEEWQKFLEKSVDYITFYVDQLSKTLNTQSPAGKNELVQTIASRIRSWDHPLMIRESLRKLARLTQVPEAMLSLEDYASPQVYVRRSASVSLTEVDPDRVLEADLLRWLVLMGDTLPELLPLAEKNLNEEHFRVSAARALFEKYRGAKQEDKDRDLLSLAIDLEDVEAKAFLAEVLQKKVNRERALPCFIETIEKMLQRHWMHKREEIKLKIYSGRCTEEEVLALAKRFDELKKQRPEVSLLD